MYKTEFIKADLENKQITLESSCILSVSLGVSAYHGNKLASIFNLISKHFKECIIVIGDTLHRYNYIHNKQFSLDEYAELCYKQGDIWLENDFAHAIKEFRIPFKIVRWDYFINHPKFHKCLQKIENLYNSNELYYNIFHETAEEFLNRQEKGQEEEKELVQNSIDYLKEEMAAFCLYGELNCEYEIYHNKRTPITTLIYKDIMRVQYPRLSQPISLRFKRTSNHRDIEQVSETLTLKNLLEILPGHIYWKNRDGIYLGCNLEQAKYYRLKSESEIINKTDFDLLPKAAANKIRQNDLKIMQHNLTTTLVESNKDDYFLSSKSPIKNDLGENIGVVGCSINITKQKNLEDKLKLQTNVLSEMVRIKDRLLSNLSHEIRTPIHVMCSVISELHDKYYQLSDEERVEFIKLLNTSVTKLSKLIKNMLLLSKRKKGTLILRLENVNLTELTQSVVNELLVISQSIIKIISPYPVYVNCTKYQIEQVIRNLIENAIKYGLGKPILVSISSNKTNIRLEVIDNGIAVPKDELIRIFEAFEEGSRTQSLSGGTGLGLAICRDIIDLHQGKIWVESKDGVGSKFIFTLPINIKRKNHAKAKDLIC